MSPPRDYAGAGVEIVLHCSRRRPASSKTSSGEEQLAIAASVGRSPARAATTSDP